MAHKIFKKKEKTFKFGKGDFTIISEVKNCICGNKPKLLQWKYHQFEYRCENCSRSTGANKLIISVDKWNSDKVSFTKICGGSGTGKCY